MGKVAEAKPGLSQKNAFNFGHKSTPLGAWSLGKMETYKNIKRYAQKCTPFTPSPEP